MTICLSKYSSISLHISKVKNLHHLLKIFYLRIQYILSFFSICTNYWRVKNPHINTMVQLYYLRSEINYFKDYASCLLYFSINHCHDTQKIKALIHHFEMYKFIMRVRDNNTNIRCLPNQPNTTIRCARIIVNKGLALGFFILYHICHSLLHSSFEYTSYFYFMFK